MNEVILSGRIGSTNKTYKFTDSDGTILEGAAAATYFSPLVDELRAHEFSIPVIYRPADYSVEPSDFQASARRGNPVTLLKDGAYTYRFYVTAVTGGRKIAPGEYLFNIEGLDFIGLMANQVSKGGIYANATAGQAILEATGASIKLHYSGLGLWFYVATPSFYVTDEIHDTRLDGWLPYTTDARENLRYILQIANACTDLYSGAPFFEPVPRIRKISGLLPTEISPYDIYEDEYAADEIVTEAAVIEYNYLQTGADPETLYEATGASAELVVFDGPHYDLSASGLTIDESGANYAIVSGTGTLTGRPYTTTTRQLTDSTGISGAPATRTLDNPLCSSLNSAAMLQRMVNYFGSAKTFKSAFVSPDGMAAGDLLRIEDPLGETVNAFITEQNLAYSGIDRTNAQLVTGWSPIMGNIFTQQIVMDASGTLTVPAGAKLMRLILIQGGKGGFGGYKGQNAHSSGFGQPPTVDGEGGAVGEGGSAGKVTIVDVEEADLAASYTVTVGAAGTPGGIDHGEGTEGTHSSAVGGGNTYTSSNGTVPEYGVADPMTGVRYAVNGQSGIYAGKPGAGTPLTDTATGVTGNTTWYAGYNSNYGNGGGAAYGADGTGAGRASGSGGDGGDAVLDGFNGYTAPVGTYGSGGIGGNGGGGGGGHTNAAGSGGHGSAGGAAAGGAVIALFAFGDTPVPVPTVVDLLDADGEQLYDSLFERLRAQEV